MAKLTELFISFFKLGAFTFGGGYAMLPLIQKEIVEKRNWCTEDEILDYFAVGQCTPGVIAVNTATFIGYKQRGVIGAIIATIGLIVSPLILISIIASFLKNFAEYEIVKNIFGGIRVIVAVLIINAVITMAKKALVDKNCLLLSFVGLAVSLYLPISPVYAVLFGAVCGIWIKNSGTKGGQKK
ncbi:MAG: chromate transporter [Clostridia bacterium]|nr:chromate transporter [Clostridia bacterium]